MTYMKILDLIERNYKVDGDWVYEKGKSKEIKIIKALLEEYIECRAELLELREQLEQKAERLVARLYAVNVETARRYFNDEIEAYMRLLKNERSHSTNE